MNKKQVYYGLKKFLLYTLFALSCTAIMFAGKLVFIGSPSILLCAISLAARDVLYEKADYERAVFSIKTIFLLILIIAAALFTQIVYFEKNIGGIWDVIL